jgi:hypothetical protein
MAEKKFTISDLKAEAERLHAAGKMPSLEDVLSAVSEAREKYAPKIIKAREEENE